MDNKRRAMENGRGAMSHGQLTMDNERAETAVMLNNALSLLTPHPPFGCIRFHLVPPASGGEGERGRWTSRHGRHWHLAFFALLASLRFNFPRARIPLGRTKFQLLRAKFQLFRDIWGMFWTRCLA